MKKLYSIIGVMVMAAAIYGGQQRSGPAVPRGSMALPDCQGKPLVQPERVTLTCADGNFSIENMRWTGWGESFAAGMGAGKINDCEPSCVGGHFHTYPMLLIATGRQTCPNGQPAYEKVTYAFVGRSAFPPNAPATTDPTRQFRCRATQ